MRTRIAIVAGMLALAGCEQASAPPPPQGTDARAALRDMADGARRAVLIRAIRDADQPCQQVASASYQREVGPQSLWAAQCEGGGLWAVLVSADGSASVSACGGKAADGQPLCGLPPG